MKPENKVLLEAGVEITYTTGQVAKIFRKTRQWVLWSLHNDRFLDEKDEPFRPEMIAGQYSWTATNIKDAAVSCYNRKKIDLDELKRVIRKVIKDTGEINERF